MGMDIHNMYKHQFSTCQMTKLKIRYHWLLQWSAGLPLVQQPGRGSLKWGREWSYSCYESDGGDDRVREVSLKVNWIFMPPFSNTAVLETSGEAEDGGGGREGE